METSLKGVGSRTVLAPTTLIVVKSKSKRSSSARYILYSTSFVGDWINNLRRIKVHFLGFKLINGKYFAKFDKWENTAFFPRKKCVICMPFIAIFFIVYRSRLSLILTSIIRIFL